MQKPHYDQKPIWIFGENRLNVSQRLPEELAYMDYKLGPLMIALITNHIIAKMWASDQKKAYKL